MIEASLSNENGEVAAFMQSLDHPLKPGIEILRQAILALDPAITERIKWKAPSFGYDDDRLTFNLRHPGRIQLILHRGTQIKNATGFTFSDPTGLIEWASPDRGIVTFTSLEQVDTELYNLAPVLLDWLKVTS
jgi:hypothetical protein